MATNDEDDDKKELTPEQVRSRKIILWHQACSDLEPILHYCRASQRVIEASDIGRSVSEILYECLNATRQEFDPD